MCTRGSRGLAPGKLWPVPKEQLSISKRRAIGTGLKLVLNNIFYWLVICIPVIAFWLHSFLSIPGTILVTNQEWHHFTRIFIPQNVIWLVSLPILIPPDSTGFHRNNWNLAGISGASIRAQCSKESRSTMLGETSQINGESLTCFATLLHISL